MRTVARVIAATWIVAVIAAPLSGCGSKEEPIPQGSTYYTGEMKKKSEAGGAQPGAMPGAGAGAAKGGAAAGD